jgi:predicted nucleotidyltransferase
MPEEVPLILAPPSATDPVLVEAVRRLQELYHPEQIYLFGSTARGESGPDSDYDLMVVVPDSTPVSLQRQRQSLQSDLAARRGHRCARLDPL